MSAPSCTYLILRADEARRDPRGVDAPAGILMDFDVGFAVACIRVAGTVKQVQDLLIVELSRAEAGVG